MLNRITTYGWLVVLIGIQIWRMFITPWDWDLVTILITSGLLVMLTYQNRSITRKPNPEDVARQRLYDAEDRRWKNWS